MMSQYPRNVWDTPRKCRVCIKSEQIVLCKAERWGKSKDGLDEYKIFCPKCGDFQISNWDGHGSSGR